jgi:hypothetical protein
MKKFLIGFLLGSLLFGATTVVALEMAIVKSSQKVFINGAETPLEAYNIDGRNYFQLAALGNAIDLDYSYDAERNAIIINTKPVSSQIPSAIQTPAPTVAPTKATEPTVTPTKAPELKYPSSDYTPLKYGKYVDIDPPPANLHAGVDYVYWGQTGDKIHIDPDCRSFKNPVIWGTKADAKAGDHIDNCGICWK